MALLQRPQPRPGVLAIDPYVPGKSSAPGVAKVFKLSSNETPLGPSPHAIAAYREMADRLQDYPDGASTALREAIGRAFGLDPDRIVCGAGSDDLLNSSLTPTSGTATRPSTPPTVFWLSIATLGSGATPVAAPETSYTADVDAILSLVSERTRIVFLANPNNPTGTYVPFDEIKRLHRGLSSHVLFVLDGAYAEYVRRNDYEAGIELVATSENVVMCRTFSKIYGLAALRLGWLYGPAHVVDAVNRIRGPFNVNGPAMAAGIAAIRDTAHVETFASTQRALARVAARGNSQARARGNAERGEFRADPFPRPRGLVGRGRRWSFFTKRGLHPEARHDVQAPECFAHERRNRGGKPPGAGRSCRVHGPAMSGTAVFNRLALIGMGLIGSSIARAARAQGAAKSIVATARSAATRRRVAELGLADQIIESNAAAVEGADLVIL